MKLNFKALAYFVIGVAVVFLLMPFVSYSIYQFFPEIKTAYYLSMITSNTLFVILIMLIMFKNRLSLNDLGWRRTSFASALIDVFKICFLVWLINMIYMAFLYYSGQTTAENELVKLLQDPTISMFIANIFLIAVIVPFIEETLFRGVLLGCLRNYFGKWTAIVISACIFSALHFDLTGFIPKLILGIGLGFLYTKHDSIYPAIGLHALNNLLAVIGVSVS
ncbi:CPBP family intramembrane glutamic endopeptidase [Dehalobacter restrictus]|uniref:CPBP family intramembrane metalloprotease n=1 Tax=Dehalobacter restrictus TaxID=55583 RepID=A0A857DHU1_9FIRM|nr:type II CAAX endopeptidase family protein [Dehalobacter restrictus]QHA00864.1 CPBP family intramembrane metalloprotease [Dehalobacter restrictus]